MRRVNDKPAFATFRLNGPSLKPDEVSILLGMEPTRFFAPGDKRGEKNVWKHGHWELSSEDVISSKDLVAHIEWVVEKIIPAQQEIKLLLEGGIIKGDIFCFWELSPGQSGIVLSSELLKCIGILELNLGLDIYLNT